MLNYHQNEELVLDIQLFIIPPANKVWGYIGITLSVRPSVHPSMYLVSATPPKLLIEFL